MHFAAETSISPVSLATFGLRRDPPRPEHDRQTNYLEQFDFDTLFYDVFHYPAKDCIIALAPPALNCAGCLDQARFYLPGGEELRRTYRYGGSSLQMNCQFRLQLQGRPCPREVVMKLGQRREVVRVQSADRLLDNRRVVLTLSRNNSLDWIRDWAIFNVTIHGADAILLYDNASTEYSTAQLVEALRDIPGLAVAMVISWPFPYGPGVGPSNTQDSFYCQPASLEHARWRFCSKALGVLNADIDELLVSDSGRSVFDQLESCRQSVIEFNGIWCQKVTRGRAGKGGNVRHSECRYNFRSQRRARRVRIEKMLCRKKWAVAPSRCPETVDWGVHGVYPAAPATLRTIDSWRFVSGDLCYRHFYQISTGWKTSRSAVPRYSLIRHVEDRPLARDLSLCFPEPVAG